MKDLTRAEQNELIRLLGIVATNGRGGMDVPDDKLSLPVRRELLSLVHSAERVRDACILDLANQEG